MAGLPKMGVVAPVPGANAGRTEDLEFFDSIKTIIEQIKFALQDNLGNTNINLASQNVTDLSDAIPTTIQPDDTGVAGTGEQGSRFNHQHAIVAATAISITNTNAEGDASSFARSNHNHEYTTDADDEYVRRDGGTTVTGNILPNGDGTRSLGEAVTPIAFLNMVADFHVVPGVPGGFLITSDGSNSQGITWLDTAGPRLITNSLDATNYKAGDILVGDNSFLAIENLTPLNRLAAATAAYDMDGNTFTDWGGATSSNAAVLRVVSDRADGAVNGHELVWDSGYTTNPTAGAILQSWRVIDDGPTETAVVDLRYDSAGTGVAGWGFISDDATDVFTIGAGRVTGVKGTTDTCFIQLRPATSDGEIKFFVGNRELIISENGGVVLGAGLTFNSVVGQTLEFKSGDDGTTGPGFAFYFTLGGDPGDVLAQFGDNAAVINRATAGMITEDGQWLAGGAGWTTTSPTDAFFGAQGWRRNFATDDTGSDVYLSSGPGTGNATGGGDIILRTADATTSGASKQALTEKARLYREGDFQYQGLDGAVREESSAYTAVDTDHTILCDATGGAFTVTLPAVASTTTGRFYKIKKIDSSVNAVTVDGNASETIDGLTTQAITTQYDIICVQSDGTEWWITS